jgi:hypothetical protein
MLRAHAVYSTIGCGRPGSAARLPPFGAVEDPDEEHERRDKRSPETREMVVNFFCTGDSFSLGRPGTAG